MEENQTQVLKKYLDLFVRHKILLTSAFLISAGVGLVVYLYMPKAYQATCLMSYQQQQINTGKMSTETDAGIKDIVGTLSKIVTSRTSLEEIIKKLDLFPESFPMETAIEIMRKSIFIEPSKRGDTFNISFVGSNPKKVMKVTNALAARYVAENQKYRRDLAKERGAYAGAELFMNKEILDKKEAIMRDYKIKHYNEMPEQRESNVSQLISLQEQYQNRQVNIQELERTKILVQEQINIRQAALLNQVATTEESGDENSAPLSLEAMRLQLEKLQLKYTEKHPDVRRLKKRIALLEKEIGVQDSAPVGKESLLAQDVSLMNLKLQLKEIALNIQSLNSEKDHLTKTIAQLNKWIAASPVREAEWSKLTREYDQLKRHYDFLVSQDLQAKSIIHIENRQQGSQFRVEDPAAFPEKPSRPNFFKILVFAIGGGMGFVSFLVLAMDFLDKSFRVGSEMEEFLGVPIVCTLPYIETDSEVKKHKILTFCTILCFTLAFTGYAAAVVFFWFEGKIII
jgi:polysaccharide biosynthesis transport protein